MQKACCASYKFGDRHNHNHNHNDIISSISQSAPTLLGNYKLPLVCSHFGLATDAVAVCTITFISQSCLNIKLNFQNMLEKAPIKESIKEKMRQMTFLDAVASLAMGHDCQLVPNL